MPESLFRADEVQEQRIPVADAPAAAAAERARAAVAGQEVDRRGGSVENPRLIARDGTAQPAVQAAAAVARAEVDARHHRDLADVAAASAVAADAVAALARRHLHVRSQQGGPGGITHRDPGHVAADPAAGEAVAAVAAMQKRLALVGNGLREGDGNRPGPAADAGGHPADHPGVAAQPGHGVATVAALDHVAVRGQIPDVRRRTGCRRRR